MMKLFKKIVLEDRNSKIEIGIDGIFKSKKQVVKETMIDIKDVVSEMQLQIKEIQLNLVTAQLEIALFKLSQCCDKNIENNSEVGEV